MIDLNINSKKPDKKLSDIINGLIDDALEKDNAAKPKREYIGMSELGDECLRRVYYNTMDAPQKKLKGSKLRIFETGHIFEEILAVRWLRAAGFYIETHNGSGEQLGVETVEGIIQGHLDGILRWGPEIPDLVYPAGWETKALNNKGWKNIVKNGLRLGEPKYYGQIQLYMGYFELTNFLFTAINKDTEELYPEIIKFELSEAQAFSDRGVKLIEACRAEEPPPRMCPSASFFQAKWCQFVDVCFKDEK